MRIALGPILTYWSRDDVHAFYDAMAETSLDIVYLGEVVCSKRRSLGPKDWLELAGRLRAAGKEVVLSTLSLVEAESELSVMEAICANGDYLVEANDMAAVQFCSSRGRPFCTGPSVNIYNGQTLDFLAGLGLSRWTLPVELGRESLESILASATAEVETEVFAYGHLPLAYSARCFTARAHNLPKDACDFVCGRYPEGLRVSSQEDQAVFVLNGIQTQSGDKANLLDQVTTMRDIGVDVVRISPQPHMSDAVVERFRRALDGNPREQEDGAWCNGYWHGQAGMQLIAKG